MEKKEAKFNASTFKAGEVISRDKTELQREYEYLYSRKQKHSLLREAFKPVIEPMYQQLAEADVTETEHEKAMWIIETILDILGVLAERQTIGLNAIIEMMRENKDVDIYDFSERILDVIGIMADRQLCKLAKVKDKWKITTVFELSPEIVERIAKFKYLNPMIVEPLPVNHKGNNRGNGYLTTGGTSLILGGAWHTQEINAELLDVQNKIPLKLNPIIAVFGHHRWKDLANPRLATVKKPYNETHADYLKRIRAYEQFVNQSQETMVEMAKTGNKFWLTHAYDKRGRLYCNGYGINYQGNEYAKAVVEFHTTTLTTDEVEWFN